MSTTAVAELFDPATNRFTATGERTTSEPVTAVHTLADGRVLLVGVQPEIYDPTTGTFSALADGLRGTPSASVLLRDGTVMEIFGRCEEGMISGAVGFSMSHLPVTTRILDPATGAGRSGPDLPHCVETATLLPDGSVLLTGFWLHRPLNHGDANPVEHTWAGVFDPASGTTRPVSMPNRRSPVAIPMADGGVLLVGGVPLGNTDTLAWADVFAWPG